MTALSNRRRTGRAQLWQRGLLFFLLALTGLSSCAFGQFIYVLNADNHVSAYDLDPNTGALKAVPGSPFVAGVNPAAVAVDAASRFVFVSNAGSNDVSVYAIDAAGALVPVPGSPFAAGVSPAGIAVDPSTRFVYVANSVSSDISAYTLDATTQALKPVPGSPFAAGVSPSGIAVDPRGKFLYVTNSGSGNVSAYAIDAASGRLSQIAGSPFAAPRNSESIAIDPTGRFAYVAGADLRGRSVWAFAIDADSGALTPVSGSPFAVRGDGPVSVAVHSSGRFAYVASGADLSSYALDANTGALSALASSRLRGAVRSGLIAERSGKFVYELNNLPGNISAYAVNSLTGALMPLAASAPQASLQSQAKAVAAAVAAPRQASGNTLITAFTPGTLRNNFTAGFGMQFTVGSTPLNVTALGRIYIAGNTGSHIVKLVQVSDGSDVPGGSVTIQMPSGLAGSFAYATLPSPITLQANTSYYLESSEVSGGDQFYDLGPVTPSSVATVDGGIVDWPGHGFVRVGGANASYVPANLQYTPAGPAPSVAITAPAAGATVSGNNVTVSATATAGAGLTITSVQFQVDNINVGAPVPTSPYSIVLDTTTLSNGPHTLTAVATDSANDTNTSAPVNITVSNTTTAVAITAPSPGATVSGNHVTVSAAAIPVTGLTITSVQFQVDNLNQGAPVTTSPYSIVLDSTKLSNGPHTLTAVAMDSSNKSVTSSPVSITVNNTTTTVAITIPAPGATVSGSNVTVAANATPGTGLTISNVQFKVDNVSVGAPVTTPPYSIVLDSTQLSNGPHTLLAVATDSANTMAMSAPISINVSNGGPPPSGTPLVTSFTSGAPRNNFTAGFGMQFTVGPAPLNVTALGRIYIAGNTGSHVVKLVKVVDGADVPGGTVTIQLPAGTAGQFTYATLPSAVTLQANTSYYLESSEINGGDQFYDLGTVTVNNVATVDGGVVDWPGHGFVRIGSANFSYVPVNLLYTPAGPPPSVAITAPGPGATVSGKNVTVSASAMAGPGLTITSVQFQVDNMNVGAPVTTSPYDFILDSTTLTNGPHTLTAVATDSANDTNTSAPVSITVSNTTTSVSITAPSPGATVSGKNVTVSATAIPGTGLTITSVQFQVDNVNQGAPVTTPPYSIVLDSTTLSNGPHTLLAFAMDSSGMNVKSSPVSITVNNTTTSVSITSPANGATVSGNNVMVSATATPGTGLTITNVQFRVDNVNQGAPVTSPYTIVLDTTTLSNGPHTLLAVATDSSNFMAMSAPVTINVSNGGPPPAGTPLITAFTSGPPRNNFTAGFGMQFTVGAAPLTVTALGRIYIAGNTGAHLVKLVQASDGSDVPGGAVNIVLPMGNPGQFAYVALPSPVTLQPNTSYYLESSEINGGDQFFDLGPVTANPVVSADGGVVDWPGNGFIRVGGAGRSYVPVNLLYMP